MTTLLSLKPCKKGKSHRWSIGNAQNVMTGTCVHCSQSREFSPFLDDKTGWTEGTYAGANRATWGPVIKVNSW